MAWKPAETWHNSIVRVSRFLNQPLVLASFPALCLSIYWGFGETALLISALISPFVVFAVTQAHRAQATHGVDPTTGMMTREAFDALVGMTLDKCAEPGLRSALFKIEIDEHDILVDRYGRQATEAIILQTGHRIVTALRTSDDITRTGDYAFAACMHPSRKLDLETCIQLAGRIQQSIEEPVSVDGVSVYVTASIGFCQSSRTAGASAMMWMNSTATALREAQSCGPAAIRSFSEEMQQKSETLAVLRDEVAEALEKGQIQPWYQPQISTDTGLVTGFEALARWHHPTRGLIPPGEFLPVIEKAGLLERLAEVMIFHAFTALKAWDAAGVVVPQVGVNFAGPELSNPKLIDKIKWELDRFDLTPDRLAVEVLETVVASSPDDIVTRNINGLSRLGCKIDLDDFGTGHASITSIRRFAVNRIKIDRSFVMKSDRDQEQQRMIGAILTMAERMEVETLAEGVETVGEHALLSQLGCDHVQGFGIAKPMPFDKTESWIHEHNSKLANTPQIIQNKSR